jgi:hypothetical protein
MWRFYTLCALKSPVCIKTTVLVHAVDFCLQYHGLMHTGDFKLFRGMLVDVECMAGRKFYEFRVASVEPVCYLFSFVPTRIG